MRKLTPKQEKYAQAYVRLSDKTAAYREAYNTSKMKKETLYVKANELAKQDIVSVRIDQIREEAIGRNKASLDEVLTVLADIIRFDPKEMYDENGNLLQVNKMPKRARMCIQAFDVSEHQSSDGPVTITKKVKNYDKLSSVDKLMKHLGGYENDNKQKATISIESDTYDDSKASRLAELMKKADSLK